MPPLKEGVWITHAPGSAYVNAVMPEEDYLWAATNGDGVVRWNVTDGTFTRFTMDDGLVNASVHAIAIDQNGDKWFGTEGGVSQFNGQTWTTYTTTHGLPANKVLAITIDKQGDKWFGTWGGGVSKFDGKTWTNYSHADGLADNHIHALVLDTAGNVWAATPGGVSKFDGQRWQIYTTVDGLPHNWTHALTVDQKGRVWAGSIAGVSRFDGQQWHHHPSTSGKLDSNVRALGSDAANSLWVATAEGIRLFDGESWTSFTVDDGLPRSHITSIAIDNETSRKWFGTIDGVMVFDEQEWGFYTTGKLAGNQVRAINITSDEHAWFGTNNGLNEYDGHTWTTYTTNDGLASNQIQAIAIDKKGQMWIGTDRGVSQFDGRNWITYTITDGLVHNFVNAIAVDRNNHKWFATGGGVSVFDDQDHIWTNYTTTHGLTDENITAIIIDHKDVKWFGTHKGLVRFDNHIWTPYTTTRTYYSGILTDTLPTEKISSLAVDKLDQLWVGFAECCNVGAGKLAVADDGSIISYEQATEGFIQTITTDDENNVWFGTFFDGLFKFNGKQLRNVTMADGLAGNRVESIAIATDSQLWVGINGIGVNQWIHSDNHTSVAVVQEPPSLPVLPVSPPPQTSTQKIELLPAPLMQITLASPGEELKNLWTDDETERLYVTDSANQLYVLEKSTLDRLATFSDVDNIVTDPIGRRFYALNGEEKVVIIDTDSLEVLETISPGGRVVLDWERNRFFVADRIYDAITMKQIGVLPEFIVRSWHWEFNPLRNEFYIAEGSLSGTDMVYIVAGENFQITGDLLPDISARQPHNLSSIPTVFSEENLIGVKHSLHVAGHGAGADIPLRLFDATTLDEIMPEQAPPIENGCNEHPIFAQPINGRIYRGEYSISYSSRYGLKVFDLNGNLITERDGLGLGVTNPNTEQMYLWGKSFDLNSLSPLGKLPVPQAKICFVDTEMGRIYAKLERDLIVMAEQGSQPEPVSPPVEVDSLSPMTDVGSFGYPFIKVSPTYTRDHTIFIKSGMYLYRSTDGGQNLVQLDSAPYQLTVSPNFVNDHTLFKCPSDSRFASGSGVYRSTDGGETWQPMWHDLLHLRVETIDISPNYATDGKLLAHSITGEGVAGRSIFESTDRGLSWNLAMTPYPSDLETTRQRATHLLPIAGSDPSVRFRLTNHEVERSLDGGNTWQTVFSDENEYLRILYPSPIFDIDQTIFIVGHNLLRSTDGGNTWEIVSLPEKERQYLEKIYLSPIYAVDQALYVATHKELYRSTSDGDSWDTLSFPPNTTTPILWLSPTFNDDRIIYLLDSYSGTLYRSTNSGDIWQRWPADFGVDDPITAFEISPAFEDGSHQIFILTKSGQFFVKNSDNK